MSAKITNDGFWTNFVRQVPEFAELYQDEIDSENGELLETLMFGIVLVPWIEDLLRTPTHAILRTSGQLKRKRARWAAGYDEQLSADELLRRVLNLVEEGLTHGEHAVREAILVSFVENLANDERSGRLGAREVKRVRSLFGPNLQAGWESLQRWLDQPYWKDKTVPYEWIDWKPVAR